MTEKLIIFLLLFYIPLAFAIDSCKGSSYLKTNLNIPNELVGPIIIMEDFSS